MHGEIVCFGKGVRDELAGETNADSEGARSGGGEHAVVEAASAPEASARGIEGEAGAEEGVDFRCGDHGQGVDGFEDSEAAGTEFGGGILNRVEAEGFADDLWKEPATLGMAGDERPQIGFAGQGGEGGDRMDGRVFTEPAADLTGERGGIGQGAAEPAAHGGAQLGFGADGVGNCHLPIGRVFPSLVVTMRIWQAVTVFLLTVALSGAAEGRKSFEWKAPQVRVSMFSRDLGMLDSEREEYASNLATLAGNELVREKASGASLVEARKMVALALQLSPRNKRALVINFQLSKGILPELGESIYSRSVFARLLLTRGQLLEKQDTVENGRLARMFVELAATLDPKNEDAVYASEVNRLDHGEVDWSRIMGDARKTEAKH